MTSPALHFESAPGYGETLVYASLGDQRVLLGSLWALPGYRGGLVFRPKDAEQSECSDRMPEIRTETHGQMLAALRERIDR